MLFDKKQPLYFFYCLSYHHPPPTNPIPLVVPNMGTMVNELKKKKTIYNAKSMQPTNSQITCIRYFALSVGSVPVVGVASSAISPALRAILSRMVPAEEQGMYVRQDLINFN